MIEISEFDRILCDDILISVAIIKRVIIFFDAILSSKKYIRSLFNVSNNIYFVDIYI